MLLKPNAKKSKRKRVSTRTFDDTRWSADVKIAAGLRCEYCGRFAPLAAHHIFTRSNKSVRHYVPNGCCLCNGHHQFFAHKRPHEFRDWITGIRGQAWWDDLSIKANTRKEVFK